MSEEEAIKLLKYKILMFNNDVYLGDCLDKQNIEAIKVSLNYIEQLQQENKELKEENKRAYAKYINCRKTESKFEYILTEFEKWLEERYKQQTETLNKMEEDNIERPYIKSRRYLVEECLDKLQELKGGKK